MLVRTKGSDISIEGIRIKSNSFYQFSDEEYRQHADKLNYLLSVGRVELIDRKVVIFFIDNYNFFSGGRYLAWLYARALIAAGFFVYAICYEKNPIYLKNVLDQDVLKYLYISDSISIVGDLVFSLPMDCGISATHYAEKYKLPLYLLIFETPNFIVEYRKLIEWSNDNWSKYKECLQKATVILGNSELSKQYAAKWVGCKPDKIKVIYPPHNPECKLIPQKKVDEVTWIGRDVPFKGKDDLYIILEGLSEYTRLTLNIIGQASKEFIQSIKLRCNIKVNVYEGVTDQEKYDIISRSKCVLATSKFEGFGLVPLEAIINGTKVVAYDLPVYREYYGNDICYARNLFEFKELVKSVLGNYEVKKVFIDRYVKKSSFKTFVSEVNAVFTGKFDTVSIKDKPIGNSVTVCTIAVNEELFIKPWLQHIYNWKNCKEIIIVEGSVESYRRVNPDLVNQDGGSVDKTAEIISNFPDPDKKIKFIRGRWSDKFEMKKKIWDEASGDYVFLIDCDEFYTEQGLDEISNIIEEKEVEELKISQRIFGQSLDSVVVGGRFDNLAMERFWKREGNYPSSHFLVKTKEGRPLKLTDSNVICYHYSNLKSKLLQEAKLKFYEVRNKEEYKGAFETHLIYNREIINAKVGDNLSDGSRVEKYTGEHPFIIQRLFKTKSSTPSALKVAFVFYASHSTMYSGGQYAAWRYIESLIMQGVDVTFFGDKPPIFANKEHTPKIKHINLWRGSEDNLQYSEMVYKEMVKADNKPDYDVIIGVPSSYTHPAALYGNKYGIPVVSLLFECPYSLLTYGGKMFEEYLRRGDWINYKAGLYKCDLLLSVSDSSGMWHRKWITDLKKPIITLFPPINSIVADKIRREKRRKVNQIMSVGFWSGKKEFGKYLGEVTKRLDKKLTPVILSQYPKGHEIESLFKLQEINKNFVILNGISEEEKFEWLAKSKFVWNPYFTAGGDYQSKEAAYVGTLGITFNSPVMIETTGGFSEIIQEGVSWEYRRQTEINPELDEYLIQKVTDKVNWLLANPDYVDFKTKVFQKYIEDNHTLEAVGKRFVYLLNNLLGRQI